MTRAALDGVGLAYLGEDRAARHLETGALVRVLEPWPAALSVLIDTLRLENRRK